MLVSSTCAAVCSVIKKDYIAMCVLFGIRASAGGVGRALASHFDAWPRARRTVGERDARPRARRRVADCGRRLLVTCMKETQLCLCSFVRVMCNQVY